MWRDTWCARGHAMDLSTQMLAAGSNEIAD